MATEDDVRRMALSLPDTTEEPWYGTPGFKVRGKGFLRIRSKDEGALVLFVSDAGEKAALLSSNPAAFFTTPHYDGSAAVLVRLPEVGADELAELIAESWYQKAPPALRARYDRGPGAPDTPVT